MGTTDFSVRWKGLVDDGYPVVEQHWVVAELTVCFGGAVRGVAAQACGDTFAERVDSVRCNDFLGGFYLYPVVVGAVLLELVADGVDYPVGQEREEKVDVGGYVCLSDAYLEWDSK